VHADLFSLDGAFTPRPAWQVIEAARRQVLTGELTVATTPATHVYLRDGHVYFAERSTDGSLGVRLLVEGIITRQQIGKGALLVSGVEHLGRMFQRDPSIDRQSVELCVELMTDDVLTSIANDVVDHYVMTMYRRHPSGIDRWLPNRVEIITHLLESAHLAEPEAVVTPGAAPQRRSDAVVPAPESPSPVPDVAALPTAPRIAVPVTAEIPVPVVHEPVREPVVPVAIPVLAAPPAAAAAVSLGSWVPITAEQLLCPPPAPSTCNSSRTPSLGSSLAAAAAAGLLDSSRPLTTESFLAEPSGNESGISLAQSAVDAIMSTTIADEVAEAVRRALAAIDAAAQPVTDMSPADFMSATDGTSLDRGSATSRA